MSIRVYKVAEIVEGNVTVRDNPKFRVRDLAAVLLNLDAVEDALPEHAWTLELVFGEGPAARAIRVNVPPLLPRNLPDVPFFLTKKQNESGSVVYFRDRLFMPERRPLTALEREEIVLRVKKMTYDEELELSSLRAAVANLEAAADFQKSGMRRDPIPEDVKLLIWARDGGRCVRCGSQQGLHFNALRAFTLRRSHEVHKCVKQLLSTKSYEQRDSGGNSSLQR